MLKSLFTMEPPLLVIFLVLLWILWSCPLSIPCSLLNVKVLATQLSLTLCDPVDCRPPGSSVCGIFQARIMGWVALPFSRGSSQLGDRTQFSHIAGRFFTIWATREVLYVNKRTYNTFVHITLAKIMDFPDSSIGEESTCNAGDPSWIPGLGRCPLEGKVYPLQYSGLENSMDCIVHGVTKCWTQMNNFTFSFTSTRLYGQPLLPSSLHLIRLFNVTCNTSLFKMISSTCLYIHFMSPACNPP